jgi:hypothetical protein
MRPVLYFILTCVAVAVLTPTSLPTEALPVRDPESLDARGQEYQEQIRMLIGQEVEAQRHDHPEEELEQIRKERHETARRFYEYIKTFARPDWLFLIRPDGPRQT